MKTSCIVEAGSGAFDEYSFLLDGVDEALLNAAPDIGLQFDGGAAMSFSFWVKTPGTGAAQSVYYTGENGTGNYISIQITEFGLIEFSITDTLSNNYCTATFNTALNDSTWHHVCITKAAGWNSLNLSCYIDGVLSTVNMNGELGSGLGIIPVYDIVSIGCLFAVDPLGMLFFQGNIDEFSIYNIELSPAQVTAIYNAGSPLDISTLGSYASCVAWWRMGEFATINGIADQLDLTNLQDFNTDSSNVVADVPS